MDVQTPLTEFAFYQIINLLGLFATLFLRQLQAVIISEHASALYK